MESCKTACTANVRACESVGPWFEPRSRSHLKKHRLALCFFLFNATICGAEVFWMTFGPRISRVIARILHGRWLKARSNNQSSDISSTLLPWTTNFCFITSYELGNITMPMWAQRRFTATSLKLKARRKHSQMHWLMITAE